MTHLQIRLYRDSFNTPWGFRLQGGKDLGHALSVQRVFSNSPAEGELQRGDIILAIGGRDSNDLTHKQALDLIKHGGGQIQLVIQRPAPGQVTSPVSFKPQRPRAPSLQVDKAREHATPATESFLKYRLERLQRLIDGELLNVTENTQVSGPLTHLQSPGSNPARVVSLSRLGGGGFEFGTDYCTLPRKAWRHKSQPPTSQPPTSYGFQPKKINLSSLGGGGPSFGSDYTSAGGYRPSVTQPVHVHTGPKSPAHNVEMLNKVQESLDNISLSPRTPDYGGYQAPAFPGSPPGGGGQYIPTGVRLDMEREQEQRRQQQLRDNPPYVPTAVRIDQQMAASGKSLSPRSPGQASWNRQPQGSDVQDGGPAWKSTLKPTSVKPWDADLDYVPSQHQAPRSTGFTPAAMKTAPHAAQYSPVPAAPSMDNDQDGGPKVVHLQYNSPMGLYSNQNIQETYAGQTKAMAASGALSPGGTHMAQNGGMAGRPGERDWNQSEVLRMIQEDEQRGGHRPQPFYPQQQQQFQPYQPQQQQYRPHPPQPALKPQGQTFQQSYGPTLDEFGTSDF